MSAGVMMASKKLRVRFPVSPTERSVLEIVRALRRLGWADRTKAVRAAMILVGGMSVEEGKLR